MSRVRIKICGLTSRLAVEAAIEAGADAVGFVLADSVRRVSLREAVGLADALPRTVARVAVFRRPAADEVAAVRRRLDPELIQADYDPTTEEDRWLPVFRDTPAGLAALRRHLDRKAPRRPRLLFEGAASGRGVAVDWTRAAAVARRCRLVLAGGLTPDNVGAAVRRVRPFGVDVSSGVESGPGVKDPARIRAFCAAVREEER